MTSLPAGNYTETIIFYTYGDACDDVEDGETDHQIFGLHFSVVIELRQIALDAISSRLASTFESRLQIKKNV